MMECRAPTSTRSWSDGMRNPARPPSDPPPPQHITEAAEQLRQIIDSVSLPPKPRDAAVQALDAAALLTTVFTMLGFSARAAGVRLTVDMPLRGLHLLGKRSLLLALLNLVTNAIEAVGPGGLVAVAARPGEERDVILEITFESGPRRGTLYRLSAPAAPKQSALDHVSCNPLTEMFT